MSHYLSEVMSTVGAAVAKVISSKTFNLIAAYACAARSSSKFFSNSFIFV